MWKIPIALSSVPAALFPPLNDPELWWVLDRFLSAMDRTHILDMVVRARRDADEFELRMRVYRDEVRSLRDAGQDASAAGKALAELELAYDTVIAEMQNLLDQLDNQEGISANSPPQSDPLPPSLPSPSPQPAGDE